MARGVDTPSPSVAVQPHQVLAMSVVISLIELLLLPCRRPGAGCLWPSVWSPSSCAGPSPPFPCARGQHLLLPLWLQKVRVLRATRRVLGLPPPTACLSGMRPAPCLAGLRRPPQTGALGRRLRRFRASGFVGECHWHALARRQRSASSNGQAVAAATPRASAA